MKGFIKRVYFDGKYHKFFGEATAEINGVVYKIKSQKDVEKIGLGIKRKWRKSIKRLVP